MVALAVWMFVQMRRSVTGQGALGAHPGDRGAGPGLGRRHLRQHRWHRRPGRPSPPPGSCTTSAATGSTWTATATVPPPSCSPTGSAEISAGWARITGPVAATTRVCAYDRAGQGWSEDAASPRRTASSRPKDLHTLLADGRRARPLRAGRALHRRHLRDDLRRPVPRAGRRPGAAGQLQPRAVHPDARLLRPVRHDDAPHVRA